MLPNTSKYFRVEGVEGRAFPRKIPSWRLFRIEYPPPHLLEMEKSKWTTPDLLKVVSLLWVPFFGLEQRSRHSQSAIISHWISSPASRLSVNSSRRNFVWTDESEWFGCQKDFGQNSTSKRLRPKTAGTKLLPPVTVGQNSESQLILWSSWLQIESLNGF